MHACCEGILLAIKWFWIPWLQTAISHEVGPLKNSKNLQLLSHLSNPNTVPFLSTASSKKGFTVLTNNRMKSADEWGNAVWTERPNEDQREERRLWQEKRKHVSEGKCKCTFNDKNMSPFTAKQTYPSKPLSGKSQDFCRCHDPATHMSLCNIYERISPPNTYQSHGAFMQNRISKLLLLPPKLRFK